MTKRLPVLFILLTVLIDSMGASMIMPVMPDLLAEVAARPLSEAALWGGALYTAFAIMQFLFGPILGNLSDRFGRRPILLASLSVMFLDNLLLALAGSLLMLFAARIIGGIASATHATASAALADMSKPEEKAANFGLVGAAAGIGFVIGPLFGGLLGVYGPRAPFYAAAVLALANLLLGMAVLPETVTERIRRPFEWRRANPFGGIRQISRMQGLGRMLVVIFIANIAFFVYPAIWAFFGTERFGWDSRMIGYSLALYGLAFTLVQALAVRPVVALLGERRTVIAGLGLDAVFFMILAFVQNGTLALVLTPLAALGSVAGPALQGLLSRAVGDDQQGELQGVLMSINAIALIFAPLIMTQIFWFFTSGIAPVYLPGAPFLLSALLTAACIGLILLERPADRIRP